MLFVLGEKKSAPLYLLKDHRDGRKFLSRYHSISCNTCTHPAQTCPAPLTVGIRHDLFPFAVIVSFDTQNWFSRKLEGEFTVLFPLSRTTRQFSFWKRIQLLFLFTAFHVPLSYHRTSEKWMVKFNHFYWFIFIVPGPCSGTNSILRAIPIAYHYAELFHFTK